MPREGGWGGKKVGCRIRCTKNRRAYRRKGKKNAATQPKKKGSYWEGGVPELARRHGRMKSAKGYCPKESSDGI